MTELKPCRELDALIAEKVMGHTPFHANDFNIMGMLRGHEDIPHYSTDMNAAMEVVEKVSLDSEKYADYAEFRLSFLNDQWRCEFGMWRHQFSTALTAPHAICLAALKAIASK